jgi:hypothetical protein
VIYIFAAIAEPLPGCLPRFCPIKNHAILGYPDRLSEDLFTRRLLDSILVRVLDCRRPKKASGYGQLDCSIRQVDPGAKSANPSDVAIPVESMAIGSGSG